MTETQSQIIELLTRLPLSERRELIAHVRDAGLLEDSYYSRLSPEQRAHLQEGIDQADRDEGEPAGIVLARFQHARDRTTFEPD